MPHPATILKTHCLKISHYRGQNFLIQPATAQAIAISAGINSEDIVVEIGAGLGALALALAKLANKVIALEVDKGLYNLLLSILIKTKVVNVDLRLKDALTFDWADAMLQAKQQLKLVANLPYSISSPILFKLLDNLPYWSSATLMIQREVARRLVAPPGTHEYSRLSVLMQCWCKIKAGPVIKATQFFPKPRVESQIIHLIPREYPLVNLNNSQQIFWYKQVVKAAFCQRRKILLNTLSSGLAQPRIKVELALRRANLDPTRRAETLTPQELGQIAKELID